MINNDCNEMFSISNFKDIHSNTIKKHLLFMNLLPLFQELKIIYYTNNSLYLELTLFF